jgi:DNA-binding transcriptional ArsR family regulator
MINNVAELDRLFRGLADPTRRQVVERLSHGELSVSQLADPLAMSLPAVMQHVRLLEASGVVRSEKVGRVRTCRLQPAALQLAVEWVSERQNEWESRLDRLGTYLETTETSRRKP